MKAVVVPALLAVALLAAASAPAPAPAPRSIALTFDDLPMTDGPACDSSEVLGVTASLTQTLAAAAVPATGLVSPGRPCVTPGLLRETLARWQAAGAALGNHTATHPDYNTTAVVDYLANIDLGQALIDDAVSTDVRWFRPPFLHAGSDRARKQALEAHLATEGYRVAPVTVDNQEWVYAAVYQDARDRHDDALARRVADWYLEHLRQSLAYYEGLSVRVFGREIPQVLLLHANRLNAEQLERVLGLLEGRNYRFVSLNEALADSAYARPDPYVGPRGLSWIQRWAFADGVAFEEEPREAPWVGAAYRRLQVRRRADAARAAQADPKAEIEAASRRFSEAYVAGDTATIRQLYTEDAVLLPPEGEIRGRDAIATYFRPRTQRTSLSHHLASEALEITGAMATDVGTWSNTVRLADGTTREASGRYLVVWRRDDDGRWRMRYDMWHRPTGS